MINEEKIEKENKEDIERKEYSIYENVPLVLDAEDVQKILGIKRTTYYSIISKNAPKENRLETFTYGGKKLKVHKADFIKYLERRRGVNSNEEIN